MAPAVPLHAVIVFAGILEEILIVGSPRMPAKQALVSPSRSMSAPEMVTVGYATFAFVALAHVDSTPLFAQTWKVYVVFAVSMAPVVYVRVVEGNVNV
jgi:hypothetical protein